MRHITVLRTEAVEGLALASDSVVLDCTFGSGGHAEAIIEKLNEKGTYIGLDADPAAIMAGKERFLETNPTIHLVNENFSQLETVLSELEIRAPHAILADLGWRIEQFEAGERGFSFTAEEPLHMTYGDPQHYSFTAQSIVNEWAEGDIANVLYGYGEEQFSRRIAKRIVDTRDQHGEISTARELADVIRGAVPAWYRNRPVHPATKSFQALRIAVNDEFAVLEELLAKGYQRLTPQGRMAIITFHSLEDRIVKHTFKSFVSERNASLITKKPITATAEEIKQNPRARSAKLRIIQKHD
ncbi:MAG: 16S rRNA (cytosine(1402)-N(4))-methyltransferase RsmH [Patescibacteria group bacterium]